MTEFPIAPYDGEWIAEETERLRTHVRTVLEPTVELPPFDVDVVVDSPSLRIIQLAAERRVDLIVMGTHGRTGVQACPARERRRERRPARAVSGAHVCTAGRKRTSVLLAAEAHRERSRAPVDGGPRARSGS